MDGSRRRTVRGTRERDKTQLDSLGKQNNDDLDDLLVKSNRHQPGEKRDNLEDLLIRKNKEAKDDAVAADPILHSFGRRFRSSVMEHSNEDYVTPSEERRNAEAPTTVLDKRGGYNHDNSSASTNNPANHNGAVFFGSGSGSISNFGAEEHKEKPRALITSEERDNHHAVGSSLRSGSHERGALQRNRRDRDKEHHDDDVGMMMRQENDRDDAAAELHDLDSLLEKKKPEKREEVAPEAQAEEKHQGKSEVEGPPVVVQQSEETTGAGAKNEGPEEDRGGTAEIVAHVEGEKMEAREEAGVVVERESDERESQKNNRDIIIVPTTTTSAMNPREEENQHRESRSASRVHSGVGLADYDTTGIAGRKQQEDGMVPAAAGSGRARTKEQEVLVESNNTVSSCSKAAGISGAAAIAGGEVESAVGISGAGAAETAAEMAAEIAADTEAEIVGGGGGAEGAQKLGLAAGAKSRTIRFAPNTGLASSLIKQIVPNSPPSQQPHQQQRKITIGKEENQEWSQPNNNNNNNSNNNNNNNNNSNSNNNNNNNWNREYSDVEGGSDAESKLSDLGDDFWVMDVCSFGPQQRSKRLKPIAVSANVSPRSYNAAGIFTTHKQRSFWYQKIPFNLVPIDCQAGEKQRRIRVERLRRMTESTKKDTNKKVDGSDDDGRPSDRRKTTRERIKI